MVGDRREELSPVPGRGGGNGTRRKMGGGEVECVSKVAEDAGRRVKVGAGYGTQVWWGSGDEGGKVGQFDVV